MIVACVTCPVLAPSIAPRIPSWPATCDSCRQRLRRDLSGLPDAVASLPREPGTGHGPRVSGTPEPRLPVRLLVVDLTLPANHGSLRPWSHRFDDEDQVGPLSVATVLDAWVRDWVETREQREHLPPANVVNLVEWLFDRLDWACDEHPAVDEFASDLRDTVRAVHSAQQLGGAGEKVGRCPMVLRDDTRCAAPLRADPYMDRITCQRCGSSWYRPDGGWWHLRALQQAAKEAEVA
jgi:hypothetical protein